jgi:hypothetical protein
LTIFLVCLAVETDLQAGAQYKYEVAATSISYFHLSVIFPLFWFHMPIHLPFRLTFFHSVMLCLSLTKNYDHILQLQLLWIILVASRVALIIQSLAARLGVVTGWYSSKPKYTANRNV